MTSLKDIIPVAALGLAAFVGLSFLQRPSTPPAPGPAVTPSHVFDLGASTPTHQGPGGSSRVANADNVPILAVPQSQTLNHWAIAAGLLQLNPGGLEEPHWHPNASEVGYCLSGHAAMTIFLGDPELHQSFSLKPGEIFFVPKGFSHHIENIGTGPASFVTAWDNERPQFIGYSSFVGVSPTDVLNSTFRTNFWSGFKGTTKDIVIARKDITGLDPGQIPTQLALSYAAPPASTDVNIDDSGDYLISYASTMTGPVSTPIASVRSRPVTSETMKPVSSVSVYKFFLEGAPPAVNTAGGTTTKGNAAAFPVLNGLALFSIILAPNGVREPHWHPNAGELHYVVSGKSKYFVETPGGDLDSGEIGPGQFFYAPPGFTHYFANSGVGPLHLLAFFTHENPQDVGLSGGLSAYSNSVLGATLGIPTSSFNRLPKFRSDEGLVPG